MVRIPKGAEMILSRLNAAGYQAYVVGGCVRDSLMGLSPKDWDICTSATPEEMQQVFAGFRVVETGLKHGTLTVVLDHVPYEVTTFRVDGVYTDHRHPDNVTFVRDVAADLSRRDFTINAMAYHPDTGLVDVYGGQEDLRRGMIRCVGVPQERFTEDALRILRALRFASVRDFVVDAATDAAIRTLYPTLADVAAERIRVELGKLLCGQGVGRVLRSYTEVFTFLMPELQPCVGFAQHHAMHRWDVWEHTIRAVEQVAPQEVLRLTMLLHDVGKPSCFTLDASGTGHAYGHPQESKRLAAHILERLKVDHATRDRVLLLVECHDRTLSSDARLLTRRLHQLGEEALRQLMQVQRADRLAQGTRPEEAVEAEYQETVQALEALLAAAPCYTLRDLAVRGSDLVALGYWPGKAIGACLQALLEQVMDGRVANEAPALLEQARMILAQEEKQHGTMAGEAHRG